MSLVLPALVDDLARREGPRLLAALVRGTGDLDLAEEALQEAYARALASWGEGALPDRPAAWLLTVARRCAVDRVRRLAPDELPPALSVPALEGPEPDELPDERLRLLFTCCHPALSAEARCSLALRHVAGLTTREVARAFVEPEATTAQRLVRAKKKIREAAIPFALPAPERRDERVATVLAVVYLIFNEGYASTEGEHLLRPDLAAEALRLGAILLDLLPDEPEVLGLVALMTVTHARRDARVGPDGELVPLEEQDRARWRADEVARGIECLDRALLLRRSGPYQVQAAIACLHAEARTAEATDWPQIALLYGALLRLEPSPVVELNAAVAHAMATDLGAGLEWVERLAASGALEHYPLLPAARADLLRRLGRHAEARAAYGEALARTANPAERRYLERRVAEVEAAAREGGGGGHPSGDPPAGEGGRGVPDADGDRG